MHFFSFNEFEILHGKFLVLSHKKGTLFNDMLS